MSSVVVVVLVTAIAGVVAWRVVKGRRAPKTAVIRPERRRRSRIIPPTHKPAELQIIGEDFLEIPEVRDISDNGLAISVPHKWNGHKPTQEVELLLTLHGEGTVRARGAIRHVSYTRSDTATFGVELVAIEENDRDKIRRYVEEVKKVAPEAERDEDRAEPAPVPAPGRRSPSRA